MKIILTTIEAKEKLRAFLSAQLGLPTSDIELINDGNEMAAEIRDAVDKAGVDVPSNKIARLKALRSTVAEIRGPGAPLFGLADSKCAIENWDNFLRFINNKGRLPYDGFNSTGLNNFLV